MISLGQPKAQSASDLDINVKNFIDLPTDTVSSIAWTPSGKTPTFATSDWASFIRIYSVDSDSSSLTQKACLDAHSPCLSVKWHEDETELFVGCTNGSVKSFDITSEKYAAIGNHEGPVKSVHWISAANTLLTVSFDKTVRFWDPRQAKHVAGFQLDYKPFCSDVLFPYLAIGMSEGKCLIVDLTKAQEELEAGKVKYLHSPLGEKTQITSIKMYSDENSKMGFGISSNDARCNISNFTENQNVYRLENVMIFKAHKIDDPKRVYPVNCLSFHPNRGYHFMCTGGGDGKMNFFDVMEKTRYGDFDFQGVPVNQVEIDPSGKFLAYSLGYDWARGIQGYTTQRSKICVRVLKEEELQYTGKFLK